VRQDKFRRIKYITGKKLLSIIQKSLCALSRTDKGVILELGGFPDGFTFSLDAGVSDVMRLTVRENRLVTSGADDCADLAVAFKDITGAFPVLLGTKSIESAFIEHRVTVSGGIDYAVSFVRIINIARAYLLPKRVLIKTDMRIPDKKGSVFAFYKNLIFLKEEAFR